MLRALTHTVSPAISACELTYLDRLPIDAQRAAAQHDEYCALLERLGVAVRRLSGNESYPDACFVEDAAVVVDEVAVLCRTGVPSRRGEQALIAREVSRYREVIPILPPGTLEGGDVLQVGKTILAGRSSRTNAEGIEQLAGIQAPYGYRVATVETRGSLHLKTGCTAIDDETLFVNPEWVELEALREFKIVATPPEEPWAANLLRVGGTLCVQAGFPRAVECLSRTVDRMEVIDISELRKAEAGLTCLCLLFSG